MSKPDQALIRHLITGLRPHGLAIERYRDSIEIVKTAPVLFNYVGQIFIKGDKVKIAFFWFLDKGTKDIVRDVIDSYLERQPLGPHGCEAAIRGEDSPAGVP